MLTTYCQFYVDVSSLAALLCRIQNELVQKGTRRSSHIQPTEDLNRIVSSLIKQAELIAPFNWPMICEPNDWSNDQMGGYYTNQARKYY